MRLTLPETARALGLEDESVEAVHEAVVALVRERDAYKRAKEENDERFMNERDEARRERDRLRDLCRWGAETLAGTDLPVDDVERALREAADAARIDPELESTP